MPSRLVLNALALERNGSGVQTYCRELLRALAAMGAPRPLAALVQEHIVRELPAGIEALVRPDCRGTRRTLEGMRTVADAALVHGLDVDVPARGRMPMVATVHDLAVLDTPEAFSRARVLGKRATLAHAMRRADAVIAVSGFTAERVRHHFGREATVVHEGVPSDCAPASGAAIEAIRVRLALPERFALYVGNLEPRKEVATLAAACARARVPLVIAGAHIATVPVPAGVRHVGHVSRADLPALYGAATVVAYVPRYEGFGLPPIEALACGAAVVATAVGAVGEVAREGAVLVPVGDVGAQARAIGEVVADAAMRRELAERGRAAVATLTWERTAAGTAEVYASLGVPLR